MIDARLPWGSGIGRYVRNIVPSVAMGMESIAFTLLVSSDDRANAAFAVADCKNVDVVESTIRPFSIREQVALPAMAARHDLTWFTNYVVPLRWRGPFIATVHDMIHLDPRFPASKLRRLAAARTFAKVQRDAAHVIFVSRFTARSFARALGAPRASTVVHHGIDHQGTSTATCEVRDRTALVVAAAKEHKNLSLMLEAWAQAAPSGWKLIIVTPDDQLRSSIDLTERVSRTANVQILRGITDAELTVRYARAGFVLVPSRYEGFGLPLLEAMRAEAPVISSTADALVEVAGGALIPFVDPDDCEGWARAITRMASETGPTGEWQQMLALRNRAVAEAFTWDRAATLTVDALRSGLR